MNNLKLVDTAETAELASAIQRSIANDCHKQVSKRLSLKLALALLNPSEANVFFARELICILKDRINYEASLASKYL